jgi:hypothetical protein
MRARYKRGRATVKGLIRRALLVNPQGMPMTTRFTRIVPILRIFDVAKAREFLSRFSRL